MQDFLFEILQNHTLSVHNIKSLSFIAYFLRQYIDVTQNIVFEVVIVAFSYHDISIPACGINQKTDLTRVVG